MDDVTNLTEVLAAPDPAVVEVLERMLVLARTGELQGVVCVGDGGAEIHYGFAYDAPARLIMGMEELKLRMLGVE